jgi:hypothetical protein
VEVYCPGEALGRVQLLVQLPGLSDPARIAVELPPGIEAGQTLILPLPPALVDALDRSAQARPATPASSPGAGSNAPPASERVRHLRKAAAKATGLRGVFSGKGKDGRDGPPRASESALSPTGSTEPGPSFRSPPGNWRGSAPGAEPLSAARAGERGKSPAESQVAAFLATAGLPTAFAQPLVESLLLQAAGAGAVASLFQRANDDALASVGMSKMQILRFNKVG